MMNSLIKINTTGGETTEMVEWKVCRNCGVLKPISGFPVQKTKYFSKAKQETVCRETVRGYCRACDTSYKRKRYQVRMSIEDHVYQTHDLSKIDGPKAEVIKLMQNGSWITEVKDVVIPGPTERVVTNGSDDHMVVYPSTMKWLMKMGIIKQTPIPQRTTLLSERKFILAKEYQTPTI